MNRTQGLKPLEAWTLYAALKGRSSTVRDAHRTRRAPPHAVTHAGPHAVTHAFGALQFSVGFRGSQTALKLKGENGLSTGFRRITTGYFWLLLR